MSFKYNDLLHGVVLLPVLSLLLQPLQEPLALDPFPTVIKVGYGKYTGYPVWSHTECMFREII